MENSVILEGVSDSLDGAELLAAVSKACDGASVRHMERRPYDHCVFLQFGLENFALPALGSLCDHLRTALPTTAWQHTEEFSMEASLTSTERTSSRGPPPWVRPPRSEEYRILSKSRRERDEVERMQRLLQKGCTESFDSFDHVFDFAIPPAKIDFVGSALPASVAQDSHDSREPFQMTVKVEMHISGTGASLWSCGLLLGECIWHGLVSVCGRDILELGCGCAAAPSIVAAHLGAKRVVATDFVSEVLELAARNTKGHGVEVARLDWSNHAPGVRCAIGHESVQQADVVMWADAVYTEYGGFLLAHAALAHLNVGALLVAVIPAEDRPGLDVFDSCLLRGGYCRTYDQIIPTCVAESAENRFRFSSGLVSCSKGEVLHSRLVCWEGLYA